MLVGLTLAVLALVLVRCVVVCSPEVHWDVNPRNESGSVVSTMLGPAPALWLDVLSVAVAAAALAAHGAVGGRISRLSVALVLLGIGACAYHGGEHAEDLRRGAAWIAAAALALAGFHLAQHERPRRYIVAALVAMLVPMLLQAVVYIYFEFPATVEHFRQNEREIVDGRGWTFGSAQHELFKRRLLSVDAMGAFGLSNVFGSVAGAITLLAIGVAAGGARARIWRQTLLAGAAAAAGVVTVWMTHSKGAAAVLVACIALLVLTLWLPTRPARRHLLPIAAVLLILLAIGAVLVRGAAGPPETYQGERSVFFRYQYWQGAVSAISDQPLGDAALGVGIKGFQQAYQVYKNPLNPEVVTSAHNVFVDNIVMLGLGGLAWSVLLLWWLWRSGIAAATACTARPSEDQQLRRRDDDRAGLLEVGGTDMLFGVVLAAAVFGTELAVSGVALLMPASFVGWSFGAIGFIACFVLFATPGWVRPGAATAGLFAAAAMLLIHNQIEMTFFHESAVVVAFFIVAVAAASVPGGGKYMRPASVMPWIAPLLLLVVTLGLTFWWAIPLARQQLTVAAAADALRDHRDSDAVELLGEASQLISTDPRPYVQHARLLIESAHRNGRTPGEAEPIIEQIESTLDAAAGAQLRDLSLLRLRAQLHEYKAQMLNLPGELDKATAAWEQVLAANPYGLQDHVATADMYWRMGRPDDAKRLYQRCLLLDEQAYLDPGKQLNDKDRQRVRTRAGQ